MIDGILRNLIMIVKEVIELKKKGVYIVVVGVGFMWKRSEFLSIVSFCWDVIIVWLFKILKRIVVIIKEKVCGGE